MNHWIRLLSWCFETDSFELKWIKLTNHCFAIEVQIKDANETFKSSQLNFICIMLYTIDIKLENNKHYTIKLENNRINCANPNCATKQQ